MSFKNETVYMCLSSKKRAAGVVGLRWLVGVFCLFRVGFWFVFGVLLFDWVLLVVVVLFFQYWQSFSKPSAAILEDSAQIHLL